MKVYTIIGGVNGVGKNSMTGTVLPYCYEADFYDNENGFVRVGEYRNGKLLPVGDYQIQWFCLNKKPFTERIDNNGSGRSISQYN